MGCGAGSVAWPGWDVVHADFRRADQIPRGSRAGRGKDSGFGVRLRRWVSMPGALAAFLALGNMKEGGERYGAFKRIILSIVGGRGALQDEGSGDLKRRVPAQISGRAILTCCCCSSEAVKANYTHKGNILHIIKRRREQFHPSPTTCIPSLLSSFTLLGKPSIETQPPKSKTPIKVPEPRLDPYGPARVTRLAIKQDEVVGKRGRTPPTPMSPGFGGGDMLGALLTSSYEEGNRMKKVVPEVMMTPF